jgi:type IV secretion/conjugal transfer VirB4 family ATPase
MLNLGSLIRDYNTEVGSYPELVPWFGQITPGLVICMDGSLLAMFEYDGIDLQSTDGDQHNQASNSMEIALRAFDDRNIGWFYVDKRRRTFLGSATGENRISRQVDEAWRNAVDDGSLAEIRHYIAVSFRPFRGAMGFFDEISASMMDEHKSLPAAILSAISSKLRMEKGIEKMHGKIVGSVSAFESQVESFMGTLTTLNARRLFNEELLCGLSNRVNLATPRYSVSAEPLPSYLNTLLVTDTMKRVDGGVLEFVGATRSQFVQMLSVKGLPQVINNADVEALLSLQGDFSVVQQYRFLDREKAKSYINDCEHHYRSSIKSPMTQAMERMSGTQSDSMDMGMFNLAEDSSAALAELTGDGVNFGYHTMAVMAIGHSRSDLDTTLKAIAGLYSNLGYGVVREVANQVGAFCATIPGASDATVRTSMVSTRNLSDMSLVRSIKSGSPYNEYLTEQFGTPQEALCLFPTTSGVPEYFNFHVGDVGHFAIIGGTGAGKTTLLNLLIMMWQKYQGARTIVIDKDESCFITIKSMGGSYISIDPEKAQAKMNPLRWIKNPASWSKVASWIEGAMCVYGNEEITAQQSTLITQVIAQLYQLEEHRHTLGSFYTQLNGLSQDLASRLAPFVATSGGDTLESGSKYAHLFDGHEDGFAEQLAQDSSGIIGVDVNALLKDEKLAPCVIEYLFMAIDEMIDGVSPTMIYLEEGWYLLQNERFRGVYEDYLRTLRKRRAIIGLATQSVFDIEKVKLSAAFNDNVRTRIYLPSAKAKSAARVYIDYLGLSEEDVEVLTNAIPKRHYMIEQNGRIRLIDVALPPDILAFTRSDPRAKMIFRSLLEQGFEGEELAQSYVKALSIH